MNFFRFERSIPPIGPEKVFEIFGVGIANTTIFLFCIAITLLIVSLISRKNISLVPGKIQNSIEVVYESLLNFIGGITKTNKRTEEVFPILASIFIFIGVANLGGLIPGIGSLTFKDTAIFRTGTADFNTTFALALGSIIAINIVSIKEWGFFGHLGKFFKIKEIFIGFKKDFKSGAMAIIEFFVGLLDIISEFAKILSLSLRLFGNMYAGEVLMTILLGSFAFVVPSLWLAMSLLQAVVQTIVFGALVTVFYMLAVKEEPVQEKQN